MKLEKVVSLGGQKLEAGSSLVELARLGRDEKLSVEVLSLVMEVLGTQTL